MLMRRPVSEGRTPEQLHEHFVVEKELGDRLRRSSVAERAQLYSAVYDELFRRVPLHPQLTRVLDQATVEEIARDKMRLLRRFLQPDTVFLEMGAGDCRLAIEAARYVRQSYGLDVSEQVSKGLRAPDNFRFLLSNGTDIPLPPASVDVAYSYQLMEHVHPDDAVAQLRSIYTVLKPGGRYVCVTPNKLTGPHDISRYFEHEARGLHLKEYTISELGRIFADAGFGSIRLFPGIRRRYMQMPSAPVKVIESAIECLPIHWRRTAATLPVIENLLLSAAVATKDKA